MRFQISSGSLEHEYGEGGWSQGIGNPSLWVAVDITLLPDLCWVRDKDASLLWLGPPSLHSLGW